MKRKKKESTEGRATNDTGGMTQIPFQGVSVNLQDYESKSRREAENKNCGSDSSTENKRQI